MRSDKHLERAPLSGEKAKKLVIMLHGLGSNGEDLLGLVPFFAKQLPEFHFYSPNGVEKFDMGPMFNDDDHSFGYQWFSLQDRDHEVVKRSVLISEPKIIKLIDDKLAELELGYSDLVLLGFSQGSMLCLYLAHKLKDKVGAVVSFSGAFYPPDQIENNTTPICLIHGREDDVVSFDAMLEASEKLRQLGPDRDVQAHAIDYLSHSIDLSGLQRAQEFIIKHMR